MIYLSFIGNHDRWDPEHERRGAVRTIFSHFQEKLSHVFLFHSGRTSRFDYLETAERSAAWMRRENPKLEVVLVHLEMENPIDFDLVYRVMLSEIRKTLVDHEVDSQEKIINNTSGTPTMTACWVLLQKCGLLGDARLMQSFEREHAIRRGKDFQEVDLEIENFPEINAPSELEAELSRTTRELRIVREERDSLDREGRFRRLIGKSPAIRDIREQIVDEIDADTHVLIHGEMGTGKDVVAQAIWQQHHEPLKRGYRPIDCGTLGRDIVLSELFGHKKGAFTGAVKDKDGLLESYPDSLIFLDEIGSLSLDNQETLLRFIERGEYRRLGDTEFETADNRVIAATNKDIDDLERFKEDLKHRFHEIVRLPPLRERMEDLPLLVEGLRPADLVLDRTVMDALHRYHWPGNVRELELWLQRIGRKYGSRTVTWKEIPSRLHPGAGDNQAGDDKLPDLPLDEPWETWIEHLRFKAFAQAGEVKSKAAELLGMKADSFTKWMDAERLRSFESWKRGD